MPVSKAPSVKVLANRAAAIVMNQAALDAAGLGIADWRVRDCRLKACATWGGARARGDLRGYGVCSFGPMPKAFILR